MQEKIKLPKQRCQVAQLVEWASHVQRLTVLTAAVQAQDTLPFVTPPLSLMLVPVISEAVLSVKPYKGKKIKRYKISLNLVLKFYRQFRYNIVLLQEQI